MRTLYLFIALIIVLGAIAFVARSGILGREKPGEPANKYMREAMDTPQTPQLSTEESAVIAEKFAQVTAHIGDGGGVRRAEVDEQNGAFGHRVTLVGKIARKSNGARSRAVATRTRG